MYTFKSRVRYSEVDSNGIMTIPAAVNYMQDCSNFHSEDVGVSVEKLKERNKTWFLTGWQIDIERLPGMCDEITTGTLSYGVDAFFGYRNFLIKDSSDRELVKANSVWVYMDLENGRPSRIDEDIATAYPVEEKLHMEYTSRKIKPATDMTQLESETVRYHQIDTNGHMNNGQYIGMALQFMPKNYRIKRIRVEYKQSAMLNNIIIPFIKEEEDRWVIEMRNEAGKVYAIIEFTGEYL